MGEASAWWAGPEPGKSQDSQALLRFSIPSLGEVLSSEQSSCYVGGAYSGLLFGCSSTEGVGS